MRKGLTLFEVVLAIGLSALVLLMLASAIMMHTRMLDSRRITVEHSQLARVLLRGIANDLRGAVYSENGGQASYAAEETTDPEAADAEDAASGTVVDEMVPTTPGLYGSAFEMRFEVVRPPRLDLSLADVVDIEQMAALSMGGMQTVAYYLGAPGELDLTMTGSTTSGTNLSSSSVGEGFAETGLVRQVSDHAVVNWSVQNGATMSNQVQAEVLAPEVIQLQFRYFDGMQWWDEWDSSVNGGLPMAVEIALVMASMEDREDALSSGTGLTESDLENPDNLYQLTVYLPTAYVTYDEEIVE